MSNFVPNEEHLREVLLFCFNMKKNAAEARHLLEGAYGEHAPSKTTCEDWFKHFTKLVAHQEVDVNMAEVSTAVVAVASKGESQKTKKAAAAPKKPKAKATHPPTSEMVTSAIKMLKERGGASLPAIKKYLAGNYKVDVDRLAPFIKKYLKSAVASGALIQTKGKGAAGSFKLTKLVAKPKPTPKSTEAKEKKPAASKKVAKKPKKETATGDLKKQAASPKKVEKKKTAKAVAKTAKKTSEVKSKAPKQKPTNPTKTAAKSPKPTKPKATIKKVASKKTAKK